jgi:two-component system sensor histidine kinase DegS
VGVGRVAGRGLGNEETSRANSPTIPTVKSRLAGIFSRLGVASRKKAVLSGLKHRWLDLQGEFGAHSAQGALGKAETETKAQGARRLSEAFRSLELWVAIAMFMVAIPLHYPENLLPFLDIDEPGSVLGLERHAIERIFILLPITYVGFLFGMRAGLAASGVALAIMLPRALFISADRADALVDVSAVTTVGVVINFGFERIRREQERRRLMAELLRLSEERYREIFDNAHDAIWVQDMEGRIILANRACAEVTGYEPEELAGMKVKEFLSEEALDKAREVRRRLLAGQAMDGPYEQEIIKRDGTLAHLWLATSLITSDGQPKAFHLIARDITEQTRLQQNMRFYLQHFTRAQEHERQRIARELHDETAQSLLLIAQRLDRLGSSRRREAAGHLAEEMQELRGEVLQTLANLRRLTQDLRPRILDDLGLGPALEWLADDLPHQYAVKAGVELEEDLPELSQEVQLLLFRIAQEALRNVGRHSRATRATISLRLCGDRMKMIVRDDGSGFELPKDISDLASTGKLGLLGMYERARLLCGSFDIRSEPGQGTTVVVELPVADVLKAAPRASAALR